MESVEQGVDGCYDVTSYTESEVSVNDDTYVTANAPDTPHGDSTLLVSDGDPRQETYLRFYVNAGPNLVRARLRLHVLDGTRDGPALYATSADWNGSGLTWNNRPAPVGSALANTGALLTDSVVEYDVSAHVTASGFYGFVLVPEVGDGADFASKEMNRDRWPELVLTYEHTRTECNTQGTGGGILETKQPLGTGGEAPNVMATDGTGGYVVAGDASEGGTFGGMAATGSGPLISRFRSDGTHQWTRSFPQDAGGLDIVDVAITPEGNILMAGQYSGTPNLGSGPLPGSMAGTHGAFIAKLSPTGQLVWARTFRAYVDLAGGRQYLPLSANALATDAQGSLILTGGFRGFVDFGGGLLDAGPASRRAEEPTLGLYLVKFSWEGNHLWSRVYEAGEDSDSSSYGRTVKMDSQGNVLVGGVAGAGNALGATRPLTAFVARHASTGQLQWVRRLEGGPASGPVESLAVLPGDAVAFAAQLAGSFSFAGSTMSTNQSSKDLVLGVLEGTGSDRWARVYGGTGGEYPKKLVADAQGNLVVMGSFFLTTDLGGGALNPQGGELKTFVAKYGADGAHRWSRGLPEWLNPTLLGMTPYGDTYFGGSLTQSIELGGRVLREPTEGSDLLLLKLAP